MCAFGGKTKISFLLLSTSNFSPFLAPFSLTLAQTRTWCKHDQNENKNRATFDFNLDRYRMMARRAKSAQPTTHHPVARIIQVVKWRSRPITHELTSRIKLTLSLTLTWSIMIIMVPVVFRLVVGHLITRAPTVHTRQQQRRHNCNRQSLRCHLLRRQRAVLALLRQLSMSLSWRNIGMNHLLPERLTCNRHSTVFRQLAVSSSATNHSNQQVWW